MSPRRATLGTACALALGAAVSLGLARFAYALLLPPMRSDLGWSYFTAGAMNTVNAAGYLAGALVMPRLLARHDARRLLVAGCIGTVVTLAAHALVTADALLYLARFASGATSAATFVAGGLLAARLGGTGVVSPGLVLGIYYGGTGLGIIVSAVFVPPLVVREAAHAWQAAWWALAALAAFATVVLARATRSLAAPPAEAIRRAPLRLAPYTAALAAYLCFGLGYIGYMTFIVTLLRERGVPGPQVSGFYALLGASVLVSSWLWAGLLQRSKGGGALALLNALLAIATVLPVAIAHPLAMIGSGALFGAVFLSVVAATTAFVRHNLDAPQWPAGIAAFTIVFAAGQIAGPALVGQLADGPAGLAGGLAASAAILALGSVLAMMQKPLRRP